MAVELKKIDTEKRNERSMHIDSMSTLDMVKLINEEDHKVAEAVAEVTPEIAKAVDVIYEQLRQGGRLVYVGAGTSGRLGILDAAECPPTYGVDPGLVVGLIAGGPGALLKAVEGAEDSRVLGREDLEKIHFSAKDVVVGIAASGRTPYVLGAMDYAHSVGAPVLALTCCHNSELSRHADITMAPVPGPEVVTGSSRMKSGTAQKMVLNMISTSIMIQMGRVKGNRMVNMQLTNKKLIDRGTRMIVDELGLDYDHANRLLLAYGSVKKAVDAYREENEK